MTRVLGLLGVAVCAMALVVPGAVAATSPEVITDLLETQVAVNRTEMMKGMRKLFDVGGERRRAAGRTA